jgi:hypothetical protein
MPHGAARRSGAAKSKKQPEAERARSTPDAARKGAREAEGDGYGGEHAQIYGTNRGGAATEVTRMWNAANADQHRPG